MTGVSLFCITRIIRFFYAHHLFSPSTGDDESSFSLCHFMFSSIVFSAFSVSLVYGSRYSNRSVTSWHKGQNFPKQSDSSPFHKQSGLIHCLFILSLSCHRRRWFRPLPSLQFGGGQELAAGAFAAKIDCVLEGERLACVTVPDHPATATWAGEPAGREFIEFHLSTPFL